MDDSLLLRSVVMVRCAIFAKRVILASSINVTLNKLLGLVVQLDSVVEQVEMIEFVMAPPRGVDVTNIDNDEACSVVGFLI